MEKILAAIDKIIEVRPETVFGGSIALYALGLLTRSISDIDLIFSINTEGKIDLPFIDVSRDGAKNDGSPELKDIVRTSAEILQVKTCIFFIPDDRMQTQKAEIKGRRIIIHDPIHIMSAKISYSWHEKHNGDLEEIERNIGENYPDRKHMINFRNREVEKNDTLSLCDDLPF